MGKNDYAKALADLDSMRDQMSPQKYEVLRARLLSEAARPAVRWWHRVAWAVVFLLAVLVAFAVLR